MATWLKISLLLCTFGFFRELRPSEPFVTEFLSGHWRNVTMKEVNQEVYPFGTYSTLAHLVIVFLITDLLRYKPIIIISALAGIILFSILLWTRELFELQIGQVFFGTFMATEVAYYTYIYAKVDKVHYQAVTSHTRAAVLTGRFLAGVLAQLLVSFELMDFRQLNYISFATQIISLLVAIGLPRVPRSVYFYAAPEVQHQYVSEQELNGPSLNGKQHLDTPRFSLRNACRLIGSHTKAAYTNPVVVQWSIWWALATCGQLQVISYVQFLWKEIRPDHANVYNGGVEATATLIGATGALCAGLLNSNKRRTSYMLAVCCCTAVLGVLMHTASLTDSVWLAYINYVIFCAIFFFIITIAGAIIAANLVDDSFGLVFGINTLLALAMQTVLTVVVVTPTGFELSYREQYLVYSWYFYVMALSFAAVVLIPMLCRKYRNGL